MAKSARIDSVTINAEGGVQVNFTAGSTPLPGASGNGAFYENKQQLQAAIDAAEEQLLGIAHLIALSQWTKANPQMSNPNAASGKVCTFDLAGANLTISVG